MRDVVILTYTGTSVFTSPFFYFQKIHLMNREDIYLLGLQQRYVNKTFGGNRLGTT